MSAAEAAVAPVSSPVFVGRDQELGRLQSGLRAAAAGQPGMLLIAGEAGIGKTLLIERFAGQASQAGAVVAAGGAAPLAGGALPYAPLLQVLHAVADDHDRAALGEERSELTRVLTELAAGSQAGEREYGPEIGRGRLFELLSGLLDRLGRHAPLVLVLEDLHWADSATLDFLAYLLRNRRRARMLLVGSYRVDDPGEWLPGWLAEARRSRLVGWLELSRFTREELTAQLAGLRGGPVDSRVVAEVFERSDGNPFFAGELYAAGKAGDPRLPLLLREVLLARVRQLSPAGQRLLSVAAVGGRWVGHGLLAAAAGGPEDELTGPLREAVGRGLLRVAPADRAGREVYVFRHALLQEAVYGELLPGERAGLHEQYARALAAGSGDEPGRPGEGQASAPGFAADLAEHWYRAGRPAEALDWSVRAADSAERVYAHAEAARCCERILELWDRVADAADRTGMDRAGLHTRAARAWEFAGEETRSMPHIDEALRQVDPAADPVRAGLLHELRGWYDMGTAHVDVVLAEHREAVRLVPAEPPSAERAQVLWAYGRALLIRAGRHAESAAACEEALTAARRAGSQPHIIRAMASVGYLQAVGGRVDAGIAMLQEACASAERFAGDAWGLAMAHTLLSDALLKANRLAQAAEVAMRGGAILRSLGLRDYRPASVLLGNAIEALFGLGRWDEAVAVGGPLTSQPVSPSSTFAQANLAELEGARGPAEAALARLDRLSELHLRFSPEWDLELRQRRAELVLWQGSPRAALNEVMQALDAITGSDQERFAGWLLCLGRRALADLAEQARARQDPAATADVHRHAGLLTERVTGMAHDPFTVGGPLRPTAPAEQALWAAEHSRLDGAPDPAAWQAATAAWQQLGRPYRAAYTQWRQAEALLAGGARAGRAADPLRAAHATAVRLGAGPLRAEIEALARRARISLTPPEADVPVPAPAHPYGLTDREAAVLKLLAAGHTNRQIGQRLFISPKTASVHVTNILRKLAVRDRVQAATTAVRLGLVDTTSPPDGD